MVKNAVHPIMVGDSHPKATNTTERRKTMRTEKRRGLWFAVILAVLAGFTAPAFAGSLEPAAAPGPTMKTLDEIPPTWSQKLPAAQRFQLVLDSAAVLDKETGLVWEKSPSTVRRNWFDAIVHCYDGTVSTARKGWRLPTVEELASLVDTSVSGFLKLPSGHPFTNVQSSDYWSATTNNYSNSTEAWFVGFYDGGVGDRDKFYTSPVWCVRGGQGHDAH